MKWSLGLKEGEGSDQRVNDLVLPSRGAIVKVVVMSLPRNS